jgi:hypothetical protein
MIGVSESRVSQLLHRIREAVRDQLDRYELDRERLAGAGEAPPNSPQGQHRESSADGRFNTAA